MFEADITWNTAQGEQMLYPVTQLEISSVNAPDYDRVY